MANLHRAVLPNTMPWLCLQYACLLWRTTLINLLSLYRCVCSSGGAEKNSGFNHVHIWNARSVKTRQAQGKFRAARARDVKDTCALKPRDLKLQSPDTSQCDYQTSEEYTWRILNFTQRHSTSLSIFLSHLSAKTWEINKGALLRCSLFIWKENILVLTELHTSVNTKFASVQAKSEL